MHIGVHIMLFFTYDVTTVILGYFIQRSHLGWHVGCTCRTYQSQLTYVCRIFFKEMSFLMVFQVTTIHRCILGFLLLFSILLENVILNNIYLFKLNRLVKNSKNIQSATTLFEGICTHIHVNYILVINSENKEQI